MAERKASLPGYQQLPGDSKRRVVTPTGEIISRRQYQKLLNEGLAPEKAALQRKAEQPKTPQQERAERFGYTQKSDYSDKLDNFVKKWNADHPDDPPIKKGEAMRMIEFRAAYAVHARQRNRKRPDTSPTGAWAQALVEMGLREPEWDWAVGDTPRRSGRRAA
jgi:hypothetical protein